MHNAVALIDLSVIKQNALRVKERAKTPFIAVVKDDAYGHGAERVALAIERIVDGFAVSSSEEGMALRIAGITKSVLVLSPPLSKNEVLRMAHYGLSATVASFESLRVMQKAESGESLSVHLAVNTGMNRYGFSPDRVEGVCKSIPENINVTGVFSHLYMAENATAREEQMAAFRKSTHTVLQYFPHAVRHLAATGGVLLGEEYYFDAVRSGIALYGYVPEGFENLLGVEPAMRVYAPVAQSGEFWGGGAGYQSAPEGIKKGYTLKVGYGDGFFRSGGIGIGKLCMDACVCEGEAPFGELVPVIADMNAYAKLHATSVYETLVNIGQRAVKVYV